MQAVQQYLLLANNGLPDLKHGLPNFPPFPLTEYFLTAVLGFGALAIWPSNG
jgi:hypothetical protein